MQMTFVSMLGLFKKDLEVIRSIIIILSNITNEKSMAFWLGNKIETKQVRLIPWDGLGHHLKWFPNYWKHILVWLWIQPIVGWNGGGCVYLWNEYLMDEKVNLVAKRG